jgi:hypothetical protein
VSSLCFLRNLLEAAPQPPPHPSCVPTNPIDGRRKDYKSFPALDSGEKEPSLSKPNTFPHESIEGKEKWMALCAQAAVEQDPKKLLELVSEINRLLDNRRKRLLDKTEQKTSDDDPGH